MNVEIMKHYSLSLHDILCIQYYKICTVRLNLMSPYRKYLCKIYAIEYMYQYETFSLFPQQLRDFNRIVHRINLFDN